MVTSKTICDADAKSTKDFDLLEQTFETLVYSESLPFDYDIDYDMVTNASSVSSGFCALSDELLYCLR